jgi:hypothetical protein
MRVTREAEGDLAAGARHAAEDDGNVLLLDAARG